MKIEHKQIEIRDLVEGYCNDDETGRVVAFGGKLDIRPAIDTNCQMLCRDCNRRKSDK
ncbi:MULTISPECIES: HNH endonuclease [Hallerella]|uniref:HNH endonuclease n=1 Tax=Hallerella TaxID=2815788 RepID=UPI0023F1D804|nr:MULTISPECIES: HNH endonuclease [Hallerella]MCI6874580.1 HNH endonuclease [Hallerella sp.]MDD6092172.1 HNH endonuclease [Hallerella succinigenes]